MLFFINIIYREIITVIQFNITFLQLEMQAKRLNLDGSNERTERSERSERKRKTRFNDEEDVIPEKTLVPMVVYSIIMCRLNTKCIYT